MKSTTLATERLLRDLDQSGQSVAAFARDHGIPVHRLYWARRRARQTGPEPDATDFEEVTVIDGIDDEDWSWLTDAQLVEWYKEDEEWLEECAARAFREQSFDVQISRMRELARAEMMLELEHIELERRRKKMD